MELDLQNSPKPKKHKKHKHVSDHRSERKRKNRNSDHVERSPPPTKKQRHADKQPSSPLNVHSQTRIQDKSPFYQLTSSLYLPLSPIAQSHPMQGLCAEHLSPLLLTYFPPFRSVMISYSNPRCSESPTDPSSTDGRQKAFARCVDEYAATYVWLTADFLLFKPERGDVIEGFINLQNENNLGLVCWNFFSASIERKRLPKDWTWVPGGLTIRKRKKKLKRPSPDGEMDENAGHNKKSQELEDHEGHFQDADGNRIEGAIRFTVHDVDIAGGIYRENGFLSIHGTMLSEEEKSSPFTKQPKGSGSKTNETQNGDECLMAGALTNGTNASIDVDDMQTAKHKI